MRAAANRWTTFQVLSLVAAAGCLTYYIATVQSQLGRVKEKDYSNPAKFGGQPKYANLNDMEAVSGHREHVDPIIY